MRRFFLPILWTTILSTGAFGEPVDSSVLKTIDEQVSFLDSDFSAEVSLVHEAPGQPTEANTVALFRRDNEAKYLMLFLVPESDKGKGYLKLGENLWFYDPLSRRFTVTNAHDRFQNTNARNSDFTQSTLALDYAVVSRKSEKLGKLDTQVMELKAIRNGVPYPTAKIWVTADNLVRKTEDYSASAQLLRIIAVPSYQKVGTRFVPVSLVIADTLRKDKTQITIAKPSLQKVSDLAFTQAYLEKAGQ